MCVQLQESVAWSSRKMDQEDVPGDRGEAILYDLIALHQWPESITFEAVERTQSLWRAMAILINGSTIYMAQKLLKRFRPGGNIAASLVDLVSSKLPWHLTVSRDGKTLAVLKEDSIEIRKAEQDFKNHIFTFEVECCVYPQLRKTAWNGEGSLLAVGLSYGLVKVFSVTEGQALCSFTSRNTAPSSGGVIPLSNSISALAFLPPDAFGNRSRYPLLCVMHYDGLLSTFHIRQSPEGFSEQLHNFFFSHCYPCGVGSMLWHNRLHMLVVAGPNQGRNGGPLVSLWRPLDSYPHWSAARGQRVMESENWMQLTRHSSKAMVIKMSLSPSGNLLMTLDVLNVLCVWELPSGKERASWIGHDLFMGQQHKDQPRILDVHWWSEEALAVVNATGQISIASISSLENLLGEHPLNGNCIACAHQGNLLMLQCDVQDQKKSLTQQQCTSGSRPMHLMSENNEDVVEGGENQAGIREAGKMMEGRLLTEKEDSADSACTNFVKQILFFLTDLERFRPDSRKPRAISKNYKLSLLQQISPQVYFDRKMAAEEYEEALVLAERYNIDCDQVYQRQWQNSPHDELSIRKYLSKVANTQWLLQECVTCIPESYSATQEILMFGLEKASFENLRELNDESDSVCRFDDIESELSTWTHLTHDQKTLCYSRLALLTYKDRLSSYKDFMSSLDNYNPEFFKYFRECNLVEYAVNSARNGDIDTLTALYTHHSGVLSPYRHFEKIYLAGSSCSHYEIAEADLILSQHGNTHISLAIELIILSSIPETLPPADYQSLLCSLGSYEETRVVEITQRAVDWIECSSIRVLCSLPEESYSALGQYLIDENPEWKKYVYPKHSSILTDWILERAVEIEELSGQVSSSVDLIHAGMNNGIQGLKHISHQLQTLYTLVYMCVGNGKLNLGQLRNMSNLSIMLHMTTKAEEDFVTQVQERVFPFLERLDGIGDYKRRKLMERYLMELSQTDLKPCLSLLKQSCGKDQDDSTMPIIAELSERMNLAILCIYSCKRLDQLDIANQIVECLPARMEGLSEEEIGLHDAIDKLENELSACETVQKYGVQESLSFFRDIENNVEKSLVVIKGIISYSLQKETVMLQKGFDELLDDILCLQPQVFSHVESTTCIEVLVSSLLCSGHFENILLASQLLKVEDLTSEEEYHTLDYTLSYSTSVEIVVKASQEYFNAATSMNDQNMRLSKACLELFPVTTSIIQAEWNLISCYGLLEELGMTILPVQIRLCSDTLDVVNIVLNSSSTAYVNHAKIIQLASALQKFISKDTRLQSDKHVEVLIAAKAIEIGDFKFAVAVCKKLIDFGFPPAWAVCRSLANNPMFGDCEANLTFINFSITHCSADHITTLIEEKQLVEVQLLRWRNAGSRSGSVQGIVGMGMHELVSMSAGAVQQLVARHGSLDQTIVEEAPTGTNREVMLLENVMWLKSVEHSGEAKPCSPRPDLHSFYEEGKRGSTDASCSSSSSRVLLQMSLIRALQGTSCKLNASAKDVFEGMVEESATEDLHLLCISMCLLHQEKWNQIFIRSSQDEFALHLCLYCTCIQLTFSVNSYPVKFLNQPNEFLNKMYKQNCSECSQWPEVCHHLLSRLLHCKNALADYTQTQILRALDSGISFERFNADVDYRCNAISLLCRTQNRQQFERALILAKKYKMLESDLYFSVFDWLLTKCELEIVVIEEQLLSWSIIHELTINPQKTLETLQETTYLNLPGRNLDVLLIYYNTVQTCIACGGTCEDSSVIPNHIASLQSLKSILPGVNYFDLISEEDSHKVLASVLTAENVHLVAEAIISVPRKSVLITPEDVYMIYSKERFWSKQESRTTDGWMIIMKSCFEYWKKLNSINFCQLMQQLLFSERGTEVEYSTRIKLLTLADEFSQKEVKATKELSKRQLHQKLSEYCQHLQCLQTYSSDVHVPPKVEKPTWMDFLKKLDMSILKPKLLPTALKQLVRNGMPLKKASEILSLATGCTETLADILSNALKEELRSTCYLIPGSVHHVQVILQSVHDFESTGSEIIYSQDIIGVMKPVFTDKDVPADYKGKLIGLAREFLMLEEEDELLLQLHLSQSIVNLGFTVDVSPKDVASLEGKRALLLTLLDESDIVSGGQLVVLKNLLLSWPFSRDTLADCWIQLMISFAQSPNMIQHAVWTRCVITTVTDEDEKMLFTELMRLNCTEAFKVVALSPSISLLKSCLHLINDRKKVDANFMELIVYNKKLPVTTRSHLYLFLCEYLQSKVEVESLDRQVFTTIMECSLSEAEERLCLHQPSIRIQNCIEQLNQRQFLLEAGSLKLSCNRAHQVLQNVNSLLA